MNKFQELNQIGQSIWYDNIQRDLLEDGTLCKYIEDGLISGVTSNPTIFEKAILGSDSYQDALQAMAWAGLHEEYTYEKLVIGDIQAAADLFFELYEKTDGKDGYVSLEVSPLLAYDVQKTIDEAQRLWKIVDRPNLMIKIPATKEGIFAIRKSIANGINVNVTLIFSIKRYSDVINAYLSGLEDRVKQNKNIDRISSVASFFVSRIDTKIDERLQKMVSKNHDSSLKNLLGKAAIANAHLAYQLFKEEFSGERFQKLQEKGARVQRPLWASTSTKNPSYSDVMYVEALIWEDTVNTIPPSTLEAFRDHGKVANVLGIKNIKAEKVVAELSNAGIDIEEVAKELEDEGVQKFSVSYRSLLETIQNEINKYVKPLNVLFPQIEKRLGLLNQDNFVERMYSHDPELWVDDKQQYDEIRHRLGWLNTFKKSQPLNHQVDNLLDDLRSEGFTHTLLLGMGGSSLAPEVISEILRDSLNGLDLAILDSTHPDQIITALNRAPITRTLFIVSSKSGTTSEVNALLSFFWQKAHEEISHKPGRNFIAITDPNTSLHRLAQEKEFRKVFLADPDVGGRYSALTAFGMVPAGLMGVNIKNAINIVEKIAHQCEPNVDYQLNLGLVLGSILGEATLQGKNKLTIFTDQKWKSFGSWLEQLVAESSGKENRGIIPVDLEPIVDPSTYSKDRIFIYLRESGELDLHLQKIKEYNHPVLTFELHDPVDLFKEFFRWEYAIAVACFVIGVNAFDQPNVQESKDRTKEMIKLFQKQGNFEHRKFTWEDDAVSVFTNIPQVGESKNLNEFLNSFITQTKQDDYIAMNAYLARNDENLIKMQTLRKAILNKIGNATTLGFGPRFLHSTGQLHKGGPEQGLFIIITDEPKTDVNFPGENMGFRDLIRAQVLGDIESLISHDRKIMHLHLKEMNALDAVIF